MAHEAGKGDKQRPGDVKLFEEGYDRIFGKKPPVERIAMAQESVVAIQQLENERLFLQKTLDK